MSRLSLPKKKKIIYILWFTINRLSLTSLNALTISTKWTHFPKHKTYSHDSAYESKIKSRSTQMAHCTYSFPSKCGINYLHQTGKPLPMNCLKVETKLKTGLLCKTYICATCLWKPSGTLYCSQDPSHRQQYHIQQAYEISINGMMRKCH